MLTPEDAEKIKDLPSPPPTPVFSIPELPRRSRKRPAFDVSVASDSENAQPGSDAMPGLPGPHQRAEGGIPAGEDSAEAEQVAPMSEHIEGMLDNMANGNSSPLRDVRVLPSVEANPRAPMTPRIPTAPGNLDDIPDGELPGLGIHFPELAISLELSSEKGDWTPSLAPSAFSAAKETDKIATPDGTPATGPPEVVITVASPPKDKATMKELAELASRARQDDEGVPQTSLDIPKFDSRADRRQRERRRSLTTERPSTVNISSTNPTHEWAVIDDDIQVLEPLARVPSNRDKESQRRRESGSQRGAGSNPIAGIPSLGYEGAMAKENTSKGTVAYIVQASTAGVIFRRYRDRLEAILQRERELFREPINSVVAQGFNTWVEDSVRKIDRDIAIHAGRDPQLSHLPLTIRLLSSAQPPYQAEVQAILSNRFEHWAGLSVSLIESGDYGTALLAQEMNAGQYLRLGTPTQSQEGLVSLIVDLHTRYQRFLKTLLLPNQAGVCHVIDAEALIVAGLNPLLLRKIRHKTDLLCRNLAHIILDSATQPYFKDLATQLAKADETDSDPDSDSDDETYLPGPGKAEDQYILDLAAEYQSLITDIIANPKYGAQPDLLGRLPVHIMCENGQADHFFKCASTIHYDHGTSFGTRPLHHCLAGARRALSEGADLDSYLRIALALVADPTVSIDALTPADNSPLHLAACVPDLFPVFQELLFRLDKPNVRNRESETPLHHAMAAWNFRAAQLLVNHPDVDINAEDDGEKTPLMVAVAGGFVGGVELLLARGAIDTDKPDVRGRTPFAVAVRMKEPEIVRLFSLRDDVDPQATDNRGLYSPLGNAVRVGKDMTELITEGFAVEAPWNKRTFNMGEESESEGETCDEDSDDSTDTVVHERSDESAEAAAEEDESLYMMSGAKNWLPEDPSYLLPVPKFETNLTSLVEEKMALAEEIDEKKDEIVITVMEVDPPSKQENTKPDLAKYKDVPAKPIAEFNPLSKWEIIKRDLAKHKGVPAKRVTEKAETVWFKKPSLKPTKKDIRGAGDAPQKATLASRTNTLMKRVVEALVGDDGDGSPKVDPAVVEKVLAGDQGDLASKVDAVEKLVKLLRIGGGDGSSEADTAIKRNGDATDQLEDPFPGNGSEETEMISKQKRVAFHLQEESGGGGAPLQPGITTKRTRGTADKPAGPFMG
ncbi:hypothetical protein EJ06DRAFT_547292 [Trichodelitschia bisporula]|uniref:Uncharacterized protein n=1 Tax=Trichodelitschia bisporula TaxID=703511 RepID=A0A6G1I4F5_9PEZI|nr:hypothetical protein EJ06DRAFT_547292 [Trichodelitschia bisporula]